MVRDYQRKRVYKAEEDFLAHARGIEYGRDAVRKLKRMLDFGGFLGVQELHAALTLRTPVDICRRPYRKYPCAQLLRNKDGSYTGKILLPGKLGDYSLWHPVVVLHEYAHLLTWAPEFTPFHGPEFMGTFLSLVESAFGERIGTVFLTFVLMHGVDYLPDMEHVIHNMSQYAAARAQLKRVEVVPT